MSKIFKTAAVAFAFAWASTPSFAETIKATKLAEQPNVTIYKADNFSECTATATIEIPGGSKIELSATAATCDEAIRMVMAGVRSAMLMIPH